MSAPLLSLQDIHLRFGSQPLLDGAALAVGAGEKVCLVGRNGSGKSTLLKVAAGMIEADEGERIIQQGTTIRYLPQEPDLSGFKTVLDYVEAGLAPGDDPYRARTMIEALGISPDASPSHLSGGETRRAALARALAPEPDILLLDEPTNHLDLPAIEWLESELRGMRSALVLISHDRRFLQNLSDATVWLDRGRTRRLDKGFGEFESWRDDILEREATEQHKLDRRILAETAWATAGIPARRKRNQGRLRALTDMRQTRREARRVAGDAKMVVSEAEVSGKRVIEAKGISKAFDGRTVVGDLSLRIQRGDRLGIVGPNGAGKTTLIKLLTGVLPPDTGTVQLGANVEGVTLDQKREALDPLTTLADALTHGHGERVVIAGVARHVIGYMKDFLFQPEQARTPVGVLSGGERGRVMLARALAKPANLLILDEPTNDLDLETLDLLQELLADHPGTVLLVSHDRDFLDRVVTSTLAFEGDGRWVEYAGGYSDMVAQRGKGVEAPGQPRALRTKATESRTATGPAPKRRLGFKENHALKTLPGRIEALQTEMASLQKTLDDPKLYIRDPGAFAKVASTLEEKRAALTAAEDEWLVLELLREELEA